jgi:putative phosphoesterase
MGGFPPSRGDRTVAPGRVQCLAPDMYRQEQYAQGHDPRVRRRVSRARRVAVLSDVHGNAVALAAVLAEADREDPDLFVFGGDLTWGAEPSATYELAAARAERAVYIRGNADRALLEGRAETERERWMQESHSPEALAFIRRFDEQAVVDVDGLGPVRFCHGSPRSDEECVTPETPAERVGKFMDGLDEDVLVTAHVHIQFDREVAGIRSVNPGSVGLPYQGRLGAYWALLGPGVELRHTEYDVARAVDAYRESGFPEPEQLVELLERPPSRAEVVEDAERRVFAG